MVDYDTRFGQLIDPQPNFYGVSLYAWESNFAPLSLTSLNEHSSRQLKRFMDDVRSGFRAGSLLSNDINILWVVDKQGKVLFAIEEMFFDGIPAGRPYFKTFEPTMDIPKLGHPALISSNEDKKGRIAGEIYFNEHDRIPNWVINRYSGRYGKHPSRTFSHLRNVANEFRNYGIELEIEFKA